MAPTYSRSPPISPSPTGGRRRTWASRLSPGSRDTTGSAAPDDGVNRRITETRPSVSITVNPLVRGVSGYFARKLSIRFLIFPLEGFSVRPMAGSLWNRRRSGMSLLPTGGRPVQSPRSERGPNVYAHRTALTRSVGRPLGYRIPGLQAVRNVAAFKSVNVGVKNGVSNVIPSVSLLVQQLFTWPSRTATETECQRPTIVYSPPNEGCR